MALAQLGSLLPHVVVPAVMPSHLIPEWNLTYSQAGLMAASYAAGYMVAVPVLTTLTDRIDARLIRTKRMMKPVTARLATRGMRSIALRDW